MEVRFYEKAADSLLKYAVIIARYEGKYVFCKHRERDSLEIPGGHREKGEEIGAAAQRELWEETGALAYDMEPVCVYSVVDEQTETYGMLYCARISRLDPELHSEIEKIALLDGLPENWTYPDIQPALMAEAKRRGAI